MLQTVKLGELCVEDRETIEPKSPEAQERPYLSLEHIFSSSGEIIKNQSLAAEDEGRSLTFAFDNRHVLYGKLRPYLNKVALPDFAGRCTTELIPLLPNPGTDREFLAWILRRQETVSFAMQGKTGSRMPRADMDELMKMEVPFFPLVQQQRIAARVREQMAEVERARAALQAQLETAQALPASVLRDVFDGPAAKKWPLCRLGDSLVLRKEIVHPSDNPKGSAIFVGLEHVESQIGKRIGGVNVELAELTGRKPRFRKSDIVYGYLRPYLNKVWVADFDGLCSVDQYAYSVRSDIADTGFIAWFMRSPCYLERAPIGDTPGQLPRIRLEEVAAVQIGLPSLAEQRAVTKRIETEIETFTELREALQSRLAEIELLPAALLRQAFSGSEN